MVNKVELTAEDMITEDWTKDNARNYWERVWDFIASDQLTTRLILGYRKTVNVNVRIIMKIS